MEINFANTGSNSGLTSKILGVILFAVIAGGAVYFFVFNNSVSPDPNAWQAVFLENEQVYFGKLKISGDFYVLEKVYYLQTEESAVAGLDNTASISGTEIKQTSTKLVKLGNELHGPEDRMYIEKSKVLFWENMKSSSNISQTIENNEI